MDMDFSSAAGSTLAALSGRIIDSLPAFFSTFMSVLVLAPFFAFFMLLDGQTVMKKLMAMVPNHLFEPALTLAHRVNAQLGGFIRARLLEAGIVGMVVWLGLAAIGYPYSLLLAVFAALMNLIPYIGPVIGAVPALVIGPVMGVAAWKIWLVAGVYVSAQLIDMLFIIPLVVAKIINLHPVTVVMVIIIGAQLAGIVGMVISIPIACIVKLLTTPMYQHLVGYQH
jgi:putative permease